MIIDDKCKCGSIFRLTCAQSTEACIGHNQWLEAHEVCRQPIKPRRLTYDAIHEALSQLDNQTQPPATDIVERHVQHYRTCGCLGTSDKCCDQTCPCHKTDLVLSDKLTHVSIHWLENSVEDVVVRWRVNGKKREAIVHKTHPIANPGDVDHVAALTEWISET